MNSNLRRAGGASSRSTPSTRRCQGATGRHDLVDRLVLCLVLCQRTTKAGKSSPVREQETPHYRLRHLLRQRGTSLRSRSMEPWPSALLSATPRASASCELNKSQQSIDGSRISHTWWGRTLKHSRPGASSVLTEGGHCGMNSQNISLFSSSLSRTLLPGISLTTWMSRTFGRGWA